MRIFLAVLLSVLVTIINTPVIAYGCFEVERDALLTFKAGLYDPGNLTSSWHGRDCCNWDGIICDKLTGRVVKLTLRNPYVLDDSVPDFFSNWMSHALSGEINPSLLSLKHLTHLDLSNHYFSNITIPKFIGSFEDLVYLNLSSSWLEGTIPREIGNLLRLRVLDLAGNQFTFFIPPQLGNLSNLLYLRLSSCTGSTSWLSHLSNLRYLEIAGALQDGVDWLAINRMHLLKTLILSDTDLSEIPMDLGHVNLTHLTKLDLSFNSFHHTLPNWLWNLTSLLYLDLSNSEFNGSIPHALTNLASLNYLSIGRNNFEHVFLEPISKLNHLRFLDLNFLKIGGDIANLIKRLGPMWYNLEVVYLQGNNLLGNISNWIGQMKNLSIVDLSSNSLSGHISCAIGTLAQLKELNVQNNSLTGLITETHLVNLSNLDTLVLSDNMLTIRINDKWVPPFQLQSLSLSLCKVGPTFPSWLRGQTQLTVVELLNTSIIGAIPTWFWDMPLRSVDLSYNAITSTGGFNQRFVNVNGPKPSSWSTLEVLNIAQNIINGSIPYCLCEMAYLNLYFLDLSNNAISGDIPICWKNNSNLNFLDLSDNQITGKLPSSIGSLKYLSLLQLDNNKLQGEIPTTLQYCIYLEFLSLGRNNFSGKIPLWIGKQLQGLNVLQLHSNKFTGLIPPELGELSGLQILDLSHNSLVGPIPSSMSNLYSMKNSSLFFDTASSFAIGYEYEDTLSIDINGQQQVYTSMPLALAKTIDISGNYLTGRIPKEIWLLEAVINLNLSNNHLMGEIPEAIGAMRSLESLDISCNHLSGPIPNALSSLFSLHNLNLSYNNFSGNIPTGRQLDTLNNPSIYAGNPYLCGPPINKSCFEDQTNRGIDFAQDSSAREMEQFYLAVALGCIVGFWCLWAALIFHNSCKVAYFQLVDKMYVHTMLAMRRFGWL